MQRSIAIVVCPGFEMLDLSGPLCAFGTARNFYGAEYDFTVLSPRGGLVETYTGIPVGTRAFPAAKKVDTMLVAGGPAVPDEDGSPEIADLIGEYAPGIRRVGSVCTGAFHLARSGLLDGRRATTHWACAPLLQARYPRVTVDADRMFVQDAGVWTSAGMSAGIDLALALIEEDLGTAFSKSVARAMVVHYRRPGGQSQFSALADLRPTSDRVKDALGYARDNLDKDLTVERLAAAANVSGRQFARLFRAETGATPARAVERLRAEVARPRVEEGRESLEQIAREVGFGDVERMRRSFVKLYGQSAQTLRRLARSQPDG